MACVLTYPAVFIASGRTGNGSALIWVGLLPLLSINALFRAHEVSDLIG